MPQDAAAIARLLESCGLPSADAAHHLAHFFVAKSGDTPVGVIGLERAGLLRSLAVAPGFRSRGIARALCTRLEEHAAELGIRTLYLLTTSAEGFFAAAGFSRISRDAVLEAIRSTLEFSTLCPASAVVMVKELRSRT